MHFIKTDRQTDRKKDTDRKTSKQERKREIRTWSLKGLVTERGPENRRSNTVYTSMQMSGNLKKTTVCKLKK